MSWVPVHIDIGYKREGDVIRERRIVHAVEIVGPFMDQGPHVQWALVEHDWGDGARSLLIEDARELFDTGKPKGGRNE